jgi:hypothetical protein
MIQCGIYVYNIYSSSYVVILSTDKHLHIKHYRYVIRGPHVLQLHMPMVVFTDDWVRMRYMVQFISMALVECNETLYSKGKKYYMRVYRTMKNVLD